MNGEDARAPPIPFRELGSVIAIYPVIPATIIIKIATVMVAMRMSFSLSCCDMLLCPFYIVVSILLNRAIPLLTSLSTMLKISSLFG